MKNEGNNKKNAKKIKAIVAYSNIAFDKNENMKYPLFDIKRYNGNYYYNLKVKEIE